MTFTDLKKVIVYVGGGGGPARTDSKTLSIKSLL